MSYSDYMYDANRSPEQAASDAAAQKQYDATTSSGTMDNPMADWAHDTFGKADDVHMPTPDWSTAQYGGSVQAANQNQQNLKYQGINADQLALQGGSIYSNQQQQSAEAAQGVSNQANAHGQQVAQSGLSTQQQAATGIGNWLQQGPGPSVAQAQLAQGNNTNVANMMAMAASGRGQGGGAAAQQSAAFQAANAGQQTNEQASVLRAQEAQSYKQNQMAGMQAQAGIGQSIVGAGQNQQNLGLNYSQLAANQQQSAGNTELNYMNAGNQNSQYYTNLQQQQLANQTQAATGLENTRMTTAEDAEKANQQSTYQHQSGVGGMIGAAAGALAFL